MIVFRQFFHKVVLRGGYIVVMVFLHYRGHVIVWSSFVSLFTKWFYGMDSRDGFPSLGRSRQRLVVFFFLFFFFFFSVVWLDGWLLLFLIVAVVVLVGCLFVCLFVCCCFVCFFTFCVICFIVFPNSGSQPCIFLKI